jgi:hypothetical protein
MQQKFFPFDEILLYNNEEEGKDATLLLRYQPKNPSSAVVKKGLFYFDVESLLKNPAAVPATTKAPAKKVLLGADAYKLHTANPNTKLSRELLQTYFETFDYPFTRHHIDSYDQFLQEDLISIIRSQNPVIILKDLIDDRTSLYRYRVEIYIGGESGNEIEIGTPTLFHQLQQEVRVLFPNEARLRNLTYASTVYANITVKIQYVKAVREVVDLSP